MQSRPKQNENLQERKVEKGREPKKGGRGTMPPDAESSLPEKENLMEKDLNKGPEPVKGGRGTMLPPPDAESTLPKKESLQERSLNKGREPKKGGRGTMLPPPDEESTLPAKENIMEKDLSQGKEPVKGGKGTMLPPPDAESTLPEKENLQERNLNKGREPIKGGRGTMLPPPDEESTLPGVDDVPIAEGGVISRSPYDTFAGTGLTSQSFGTDDYYDHHKHKYHELNIAGENQEEEDSGNYNYSGAELRRLPSYEIQNPHQTNVSGLRKASFNLEQKSKGIEEQASDDEDFTTGLMRGNLPKDDSYVYKHNIAPRDENVLKGAANVGSEKHKKYQAQQEVDKENVGTTYLV